MARCSSSSNSNFNAKEPSKQFAIVFLGWRYRSATFSSPLQYHRQIMRRLHPQPGLRSTPKRLRQLNRNLRRNTRLLIQQTTQSLTVPRHSIYRHGLRPSTVGGYRSNGGRSYADRQRHHCPRVGKPHFLFNTLTGAHLASNANGNESGLEYATLCQQCTV